MGVRLVSRSMSLLTIAHFVFLVLHGRQVVAQSTNATCALSSFQWTFNSQKQSPCQVASTLFGVCVAGGYSVQALPEQTHYLGPTIDGANPCQCNTVAYSLISACGLCQNRTILTWSEWATNCASVSIGIFPQLLPAGLHVPGWAYLDVETQDIFDQNAAQQDANATESTANPPTSTSTTHSSTHATTSTKAPLTEIPAPSTTASDPSFTIDERRSNAIAGGTIGAVFGVTLICIFAGWLYYFRRRRQRATHASSEEAKDLNSPVPSERTKEELPTVIVSMPSVTYNKSTVTVPPGSCLV